jgi:hypothetical protein
LALSSRASWAIRVGSTNAAGTCGHGSLARGVLVIVISSPTLSSRQCRPRCFSSGGNASAVPPASATGGAWAPRRICKRPPSTPTTATAGAVTPFGLSFRSASGRLR